MIVRVLILVITGVLLVDGTCKLQLDDDTKGRTALETLTKWGVYGDNLSVPTGASTYQIGICTNIGGNASRTAISQQEGNISFSLGTIDYVNLIAGDGWVQLTYGNGTQYINACDNKARSASIIFVCGSYSKKASVLQEHTSKDNHCNYVFQIQVPELCSTVPKDKKSLGGGAIFLIIVACLAGVYLIGGFLFMRLVRGARGIDQIPNLDLWRKLGNKSADGCDFCCRCNTGAPRAGYFLDESGPDLRGDDDILSP